MGVIVDLILIAILLAFMIIGYARGLAGSLIKLASFAIAMIGIIIAVTSAYDKDTTEAKEGAKKESRALEVGSIVISAAAIFSYFVFVILSQI